MIQPIKPKMVLRENLLKPSIINARDMNPKTAPGSGEGLLIGILGLTYATNLLGGGH